MRLFKKTILLLLCSWGITSYANTQPAVLLENKCLISTPVLNLHETPSVKARFVSQGIYGHSAYIIKRIDEEWALIETEDGYQGYAQLNELILDNIQIRASKHLVHVSSVEALIYPEADTEWPALMSLPFGSRLDLVDDLDTNKNRWIRAKLHDGTLAWVQRGDVQKPQVLNLDEMINLAHTFLERPYIWCGTSSKGFDCSGFVQTLFKQIGVILPRHALPQAGSNKVTTVEANAIPGDILFFGESKITHVGLCLDQESFIHAGVRNNTPKTTIASFEKTDYNILEVKRIKKPVYQATISPITRDIRAKMTHSWRDDNPVALDDLRYIQLNHFGFDKCIHNGEIIVHKDVANEVVDIFEELFNQEYPIEKMLLVDAYNADDELCCSDNNSSAFCSRPKFGKKVVEWSMHSYGIAIDINPLLNPFHRNNIISPTNGEPFLDRTLNCIGMINTEDAAYKAFTSRGWIWGGHWTSLVDYQHFQKELL